MSFEGLDASQARSFAERWLPAWSGNRPEQLAAFYSEDCFYSDPAIPAGVHGRDALLSYFRGLLARNPDWTWTHTHAVPLEHGFLNYWHATIPVAGQKLELDGVCTVELRAGRIVRNQVFFDTSPMLREAAAFGPTGDRARHRAGASLDAGLDTLPAAATDSGRLALLVRRLPGGVRETPAEAWLSVLEGVPGDEWNRRQPQKPDAQLAVMRRDVAELIANEQELTLFGDNLFVDLDLSAGNLPVGTELRVGEARVVMTAEPHNGCRKFHQRFGADALRFVQARETRDQNRRGVYWRVIEPGLARVGDAVRVLSRP
jgi:MOSC domain-containing protein YiiM